MYISRDKLLVVGFGIVLFASILLFQLISSIFHISYAFAFFICFIPLVIALTIGLLFLNKKDWYNELTNYSYYKFNQVYTLYRIEVIRNNKAYIRFVNDYISENQLISYPIDLQGNPIISEYNKKNKIVNQIIDLLNNRKDLVDKYFEEECFRYPHYLSLFKEYDSPTTHKEIEVKFEQNIPTETNEEKLLKVKREIIKYESGEKQPKHIGQRMFGYLLKANYFLAYNDERRLTEWQNFTGLDSKPEMSYLRAPLYNKNSIDKDKFATQLNQIEEFFYLIGLTI